MWGTRYSGVGGFPHLRGEIWGTRYSGAGGLPHLKSEMWESTNLNLAGFRFSQVV